MHAILTTDDHIVRHVTIHYGPGRSATPGRLPERYDWALIERKLNEDNRLNSIVIDYFEDAAGKHHPRVDSPLFEGLDVVTDVDDRLHRATLHPTPNSVWLDDQSYPLTLHLFTNKFEVLVKRGSLNWSASIAAIVTLHLESGKLTVTR